MYICLCITITLTISEGPVPIQHLKFYQNSSSTVVCNFHLDHCIYYITLTAFFCIPFLPVELKVLLCIVIKLYYNVSLFLLYIIANLPFHQSCLMKF